MNSRILRTLEGAGLGLILIFCLSPNSTYAATSQKVSVTHSKIPTVSGAWGKVPVISKPSGVAPSKLVIKDLITGTGQGAVSSSVVTAQYVLISWKTGAVLDSSWKRGPATFGLSQVIPGWQQGLPGMKVGGRRLLIIPPALGYGPAGTGPIGPNETLVFVVDLVGVN